MNIYLHPSGVKKELKNDYIGEVYEYSYNFRNKSSTDITNAGWKIYGTPITDSNGVTCNTSIDITLLYPILASNAKKITIETTAKYIQGNAMAFTFGLQLEDTKYASNYTLFYVASNADYNGTKIVFGKSGTRTEGTNIGGIGSSTYTAIFEIDLVNKIITGSISGYNNSTLSLTDTQSKLIRSMKFINLYTTQNTFYLQDVSIKVE